MAWERAAALGGVVGPVAFALAWSVLGTAEGYDPVSTTISHLAAQGREDRTWMQGGLLTLGAGLLLAGPALRGLAGRTPALLVSTTGAATLLVVATPLEGSLGGWPHLAAAGTGYLTLAGAALLGGWELRRRGVEPGASLALGAGCALALVASLVDGEHAGLWQRLGLSLGHLWVAAASTAVVLQARRGPQRGTP